MRVPILNRRTARLLAAGAAAAWLAAMPALANAEVTRRVLGPNDESTGLVIISPFRIEEDVEPGVPSTIEMTLTNDSDEAVDVSIAGTDLAASSDPRNFVEKVEDGEFGAGDWLEAELTDLRMEPWELVKFDVRVSPPVDAPVGTNLAGLTVNTGPAEGQPGTGDQTATLLRSEALVQIFLTIPGPIDHDLRILDVDVRDTFIFGSQRFVVWDVTFRNNGTVNEHVTGTIDIRSIFGNSAHRERLQESLVLRNSTRTQRVIWRDLPWVGAFTPDVRVRGDDAKLIRSTGERVVIFPWWIPVVLGLLVVAPAVWLWWSRRREWQLYLEDDDEWGEADYADEHESRA